MQFLGLARDYRQNRRLKKTVRKVIAIGYRYLHMALERQHFLLLIWSRKTRRLQRQFLVFLHFFNYFEANYLNGIFVSQMWNVYERNMDTRTNNYVESKNSRDVLSLSKLFNEQKWKEYIHVYVYEYMFNFENWKKKSSPWIPMLCIWTVRGRNMRIFYYNFLNFLWKWRPMKF